MHPCLFDRLSTSYREAIRKKLEIQGLSVPIDTSYLPLFLLLLLLLRRRSLLSSRLSLFWWYRRAEGRLI